MLDLVRRLVEAYGPSGFEEQIRALVQNEIEGLVDEISTDSMGNLIALKKGDGSGVRVMIAAHLDEIGLMVTHVTKEGFLQFTNIGGLYPQTLMGARVQFADGTVGVIHCEPLESRGSVHGLDKHFIDVGAKSREECHIEVGTPAAFVGPFTEQKGRLIAKSMDDRIGCAVAIETLRRLDSPPHDIYFVFSVQEEVGTRGAQTAANALQADVGIALDVTTTGDTPEARPMAVKLGKGPAIKVKDSGMIAHAGLVALMKLRALEMDIPFQLEVLEGGSTDARSMQIAGSGSAAGCISIPCRYVHSQSEVVDSRDVEHAVMLLHAVLSQPIEL